MADVFGADLSIGAVLFYYSCVILKSNLRRSADCVRMRMIVLKVVFEVKTMNADLYEQRVEMMNASDLGTLKN